MTNRPPNIFLLLFACALVSCHGRGQEQAVTASGTIEATDVNVASKMGGQILDLGINEGSAVKEGDVIALLDHSTLDLQLRQARAGVQLAEANLSIAEKDFKRARELFSKGSATQKQRDDAEARFAIGQAQLSQARAASDLLAKAISDSTIVAPVSGTVTQKPVEIGELVAPGTTVATISKLSSVYLVVYVSEKELGNIVLGQGAEVRTDTDPDRVYPGTVVYISPLAEFTPKNIQTKEDRVKLVFAVKIEIKNTDGSLKPGVPADATLRPPAPASQ